MTLHSPYKGLEPYDRDDRSNFFGREQAKDIVIGKILAHRLTVLYAASGVGKSSLLGAAVIPELEDTAYDNLDVTYHQTWTTEPLAVLQTIVGQTLVRRKKLAAEDVQDLLTSALPLPDFLHRCCAYSSDPLVLILDQFEELFRYHEGQDMFMSYIEQLAQVMSDQTLPVKLVLSIREDFLATLSAFRALVPDLLSNHYRLLPLSLEQGREAITRPVELPAFGFRYEPALVDALLQDLGKRSRSPQAIQRPDLPPALPTFVEGPYLQIVCAALWECERDNPEKVLRHQTYTDLGGEEVIEQRYFTQVMQDFSQTESRLALRAFEFLVIDGSTKMPYPEPVLARTLQVKRHRLQPVLQKLTRAKVLREDNRLDGVFWYEIYHDALAQIITSWSQDVQARWRRRAWYVMSLCLQVLLIVFGILGYWQYWGTQQMASNQGTLTVQNAAKAALSLVCVRRYGKDAACEPSVPIAREGDIRLPGPADYVLTAKVGASWSIRYPVYIHGYGHSVPVTVQQPPALIKGLAYIPGGVFRMGDKDDRDGMGSGNELPHHDAPVDGFFIATHEVTNAEYEDCVKAGICTEAHYEDGTCHRVAEKDKRWEYSGQGTVDTTFQEAEKPVVCVDWEQARIYCVDFKKQRLPTEAQWEKAAAGPEGYKWSFGNDFEVNQGKAQLNCCDETCVLEPKEKQVNDGYRWTAPVGRYPANGYGLYDMSGNVWEWVSDCYNEKFYSTPEAIQPNPESTAGDCSLRVLRGGGWSRYAADTRVTRRDWAEPDFRGVGVGFRCAQ